MNQQDKKKKYQGKRSTGRRNYSKKSDNKYGSDEFDTKRENSTNDPAWYAMDPSLLRDAASIPYSWAVGTQISLESSYLVDDLEISDTTAIPGIQVEVLNHAVPKTVDPSDPVNIASSAVYAFVRHANSGHANYDAPDLMLYLLAMSEIYAYINMCQRLYGTALLYSQRNRYLNNALLTAMGADPEDIQNHLSDFRYGINVLINKAASFAIPANMTLFNRRAFLYSGIYTEGESIKDQLYLYAPRHFYKYNLNTDGSGMLTATAWYDPDTPKTVEEILDFGNSLLQVIMYSEDLNIMSGDILKAYGGNILKLVSLPTDYLILPQKDLGVLEQMKNATVISDPKVNSLSVSLSSLNVVQDATHGWIQCTPKVISTPIEGETATFQARQADSMKLLLANQILTTSSVEATPEITMENTRLVVAGQTLSGSGTSQTLTVSCGTEIVEAVYFWTFANKWNSTTARLEWTPTYSTSAYISVIDASDASSLITYLVAPSVLSNFKYHPKTSLGLSSTNAVDFTGFNFDVDNYAVISAQDLQKLHEAACMSMLHVPSIGRL